MNENKQKEAEFGPFKKDNRHPYESLHRMVESTTQICNLARSLLTTEAYSLYVQPNMANFCLFGQFLKALAISWGI